VRARKSDRQDNVIIVVAVSACCLLCPFLRRVRGYRGRYRVRVNSPGNERRRLGTRDPPPDPRGGFEPIKRASSTWSVANRQHDNIIVSRWPLLFVCYCIGARGHGADRRPIFAVGGSHFKPNQAYPLHPTPTHKLCYMTHERFTKLSMSIAGRERGRR